jgi:hypothetical protein
VQVVFDAWQSVGMVQELREQGITAEALQVTAPLKSQMTQELIRAIRDHTIGLPPDPNLLRELSCVRVHESPAGLLRLDHDPGEHDDRVSALGLAIVRALEYARKPSPRMRVLR